MNVNALQNPDLAYIPPENIVVPPGMGNPVSTPAMQRGAIVLAVEDAFQDPQMLMSQKRGPRNSIILPMPEYYGLPARFSLQRGRTIDDPESALRERRDAILAVSVQASKVKARPRLPDGAAHDQEHRRSCRRQLAQPIEEPRHVHPSHNPTAEPAEAAGA